MNYLVLLVIGLVCFITGSNAITCSQCYWSADNSDVSTECQDNDVAMPATDSWTCKDSTGHTVSRCTKSKMIVNGVTKAISRGCQYSQNEDYEGMGIPNTGCMSWKYANGVSHSCYCDGEKCNGASAATYGVTFILLLLVAVHKLVNIQ